MILYLSQLLYEYVVPHLSNPFQSLSSATVAMQEHAGLYEHDKRYI